MLGARPAPEAEPVPEAEPAPRRPSARRKPSWCTASQTKAKFRNSTYGTPPANRSTSTAAAAPASPAKAPQPYRSWSLSSGGVNATIAR